MSFLDNIKYSIKKRFGKLHEMRIWRKYGDETRRHFDNPDFEIGEFTYGVPEIVVYDLGVKLKIGKYCSIAKDVKILLGGEHPFSGVSQYPFNKQKSVFTNAIDNETGRLFDVTIGNDVWLGRGVLVLAGVTIGDGAIIGAGAVVSKDIPPYSVAVGCPIRIVRKRMDDDQIDKMLQIRWWNFSPDKINKLIPYMSNVNSFISECYVTNMGGGKNPRLSIIIVSFNTREVTRDCLKSIYGATWRDEFEIIVVDNNSQDGSVEMIREEFPEVKIIANKENRLFSIANNQGAKIARGEYLLLLNSDTLVYDDNLQKMIDYFDKQKNDVICIGPKILNKDGSLQSCGMPEAGDLFQHFVSLFHINRILPLHWIYPPLNRRPDKSHRTGWVSGACMMVRRDLYDKVGGLNEKLIFYGEEPEFGYRTKKFGFKTLYFSGAEIIHLGGASTDKSAHDFDKDMAQYDSLVQLTIGRKKVIDVTKITRASLKFKRFFHPNKEYFDTRIAHETKVIEYFEQKLKDDK